MKTEHPDRPVIRRRLQQPQCGPRHGQQPDLTVDTCGRSFPAMEDGQTDTDPRYIRFDVPTKVDDQVPSGDYLRLGAFVDGDAKGCSPGVEYSRPPRVEPAGQQQSLQGAERKKPPPPRRPKPSPR